MHRIIGRIDDRNAGSAAVLAKVGMRREAHFEQNTLVNGKWNDEVVYAILDNEWASRPTGPVISWNTGPAATSSVPMDGPAPLQGVAP